MKEELVMTVPAAGLWAQGGFQGLQPGGGGWLEYIFEPKNCRFLPRTKAENDPLWKQVIPYVLLAYGESLFCYRRGQRSTETRLRALHSVGLGGHIRSSDDSLFAAPGWPAYQTALRRELDEEVAIEAPVWRERLVGLINDDATEVGRVHIGVVHIFELEGARVRARESKIAAGRFATLAELRGPEVPEMESWSAICLAGWERLQGEHGWTPARAADIRTLIEQACSAFNRRDIDGALALMTPEVSWPWTSEGGTVVGKEEFRAYWTRQWGEFDPRVEPLEITPEDGGKVRVRVRKLVRSLGGNVLSDSEVVHVFTVSGGLIAAMDLGDEADSSRSPSVA